MSISIHCFRPHPSWLSVCLLAFSGYTVCAATPNFVVIMIDDLGYGDLGCYGSTINETPHIDALAAQGMRFTDFHANGPMCSPTRAAFLTGRYQHRLGKRFESALGPQSKGLPLEAYTLAEALKAAGYVTGMFGKWHLGVTPEQPLQRGFEEFIGLLTGDGDHHTRMDRGGHPDWWEGGVARVEMGYTEDLVTKHSIDFLERHRSGPFFLFVSHLTIHFPWQGPDDPPHRVAGRNYRDDKWGIIPDRNNVRPHTKAMIEAMDEGVGQLLKRLEDLGLKENTLVLFTSDNGGYIHYNHRFHNISSNGPLRGQKTEVYEGGHRVPFIARWPARIKPASVSHETAMTMDIFPTLMTWADAPLPDHVGLDGVSLADHLLKSTPLPERTLHWKMGRDWAIRRGKWKLCHIEGAHPELYDLSLDLGETRDLSEDYPDILRELTSQQRAWERVVTANYP